LKTYLYIYIYCHGAGVETPDANPEVEAKYLAALRVEFSRQQKSRVLWRLQLTQAVVLQEQGGGGGGRREIEVLEMLMGMEALVRAQLGDNRFVTTFCNDPYEMRRVMYEI